VPERADTRGLLVWLRHQTGGFDRESLQWLLATLGVIASVTGVFQFILPSTSFWLGAWAILLMAGVGSAVGVTFRLVRRSITAVDPSAHWRIHISSGNVLHGRPAVITTDTRRSFRPGDVSPGSLIGQYLNSLEGQEARDTIAALTRLSEQGPVEAGEVHLMDPKAPGETIWLLACGTPSDDGTVTTWSHVKRRGERARASRAAPRSPRRSARLADARASPRRARRSRERG
jgi:hypothetical protein